TWPSTGKKAVVNAVRLTADIRARGYRGSEHLARRHLQTWRTSSTAPSPTPICPPHLGKFTTWMMRPSDEMTTEEHAPLRHILDRCPTLPPANEPSPFTAGLGTPSSPPTGRVI
ncbi:MAG TPA: hypothetical protein VE196_07565, partial [Pseudonocardiaceae bacterium]|nr:hypothetical protein [Pseudonocardiaceae bacterium]